MFAGIFIGIVLAVALVVCLVCAIGGEWRPLLIWLVCAGLIWIIGEAMQPDYCDQMAYPEYDPNC